MQEVISEQGRSNRGKKQWKYDCGVRVCGCSEACANCKIHLCKKVWKCQEHLYACGLQNKRKEKAGGSVSCFSENTREIRGRVDIDFSSTAQSIFLMLGFQILCNEVKSSGHSTEQTSTGAAHKCVPTQDKHSVFLRGRSFQWVPAGLFSGTRNSTYSAILPFEKKED